MNGKAIKKEVILKEKQMFEIIQRGKRSDRAPKVKEAYKRVEDENYAFRAYLKNHADEDELDS